MTGRRSAEDRATIGVVALIGVAVVLLLLALTGVFGGDSPEAGTDRPTPGPGSASSSAGTERSEAEDDAARFAQIVLLEWSRPDVGYTEWWSALREHLSPGAREAYAHTDPASVPVLGDPEVEEVDLDERGSSGTVWFTTGAGRFGVDVSRTLEERWQAHRIVFPETRSMFG
ncbi:hypothetical protein [Nocardioides pantholopis]|uniref:hypothetical protein n=1 Tax=Nocardioides pantholopis TaxID=2483798 RepID=UPI000FD8E279|nr:hypothetical protein [Nocardioides pantholopis]